MDKKAIVSRKELHRDYEHTPTPQRKHKAVILHVCPRHQKKALKLCGWYSFHRVFFFFFKSCGL